MRRLILTTMLAASLFAAAAELRGGAEYALADVPAELTCRLPKGGSTRFLLEEAPGFEWAATSFMPAEVEVALEHRAGGRASVVANLKGREDAPVLIEMAYRRAGNASAAPAKTLRLVIYKVKGGPVDPNYPKSRTMEFLKTECANRGIQIVDWHLHIRGGMTPELAAEREAKSGIRSTAMENHGREWEICDNARLRAFAEKAKQVQVNGHRLPVGIQVNDRDWFRQIDAETRAQFDYILADTMIMGKLANGRDKRLWLVKSLDELGGDPEAWMEQYMAHNLQILDEPISILANPTYLPAPLNAMADKLWTEARMRAIIAKAVAKGVAIEIQAESPYPRPRFLKLAREMGAKFSFGTNNFDPRPKDLSRWLEAITWLDLHGEDIWTPACLKR